MSCSLKGLRKRRMSSVSRTDWVQALFLCLLLPAFLERLPARVVDQPLTDPVVMHPVMPDIVSAKLLLLLCFIIPSIVFFALTSRADYAAFQPFFLGLLEANGFTVAITNILKAFVGRPRPHFAAVCIGYADKLPTLCDGSAHAVNEARKSFPSGHSSIAFSGAIYSAAFIATAVSLRRSSSQLHGEPTASGWKILAVLACPFAAALVAASRVVDYHHNYADVLAGSLIGSAISALVVFTRSPDIWNAQRQTDGISALPTSCGAISELPS